jgi:peptidoglycan/xylan/chitin deacetylase (PgdA/CDA1 family)
MPRAVILMYHIVDEPRAANEVRYCCSPAAFEEQMGHLKRARYEVVPLSSLIDRLGDESRSDRPLVAVTFDDGFAATYRNALPILERQRIPATMFVVSGRIGGSNDWMQERGFPSRPLVDASEIRKLAAAGIEIGSHTRTHPRLPEIASESQRQELQGSKRDLEDLLGAAVRHLAYPFGRFNQTVQALAEEAGYAAACCTRAGFNREQADRFALRRVEVYGSDPLWKFRQKLSFGVSDASMLVPVRYYANRVALRVKSLGA